MGLDERLHVGHEGVELRLVADDAVDEAFEHTANVGRELQDFGDGELAVGCRLLEVVEGVSF